MKCIGVKCKYKVTYCTENSCHYICVFVIPFKQTVTENLENFYCYVFKTVKNNNKMVHNVCYDNNTNVVKILFKTLFNLLNQRTNEQKKSVVLFTTVALANYNINISKKYNVARYYDK